MGALAEGGHGTVYLARQLDSAKRVVIKVLAAVDDKVELARFLQEAEIARRLTHPNLVCAIDHHADEQGAWIAYEHVEGASVRRRLDAGPIPWREAVGYARDVAEGLAAAHEAGILHRDVKPENLLLDGPRCRVTDFGIAKWAASALQTQAGVIVGTPAYVSPEQVQGGAATAQSDLYALGVTLYEMVAGHAPFRHPTPVEVLVAHVRQPPPRASEVAEVPAALDELVIRCMAKQPAERPASAHALAEELERLTRGGVTERRVPALAPPPGPVSATGGPSVGSPDVPTMYLPHPPRVRLHPVWAALAAGAVLGALTGVGAYLHPRTAPAAPPPSARPSPPSPAFLAASHAPSRTPEQIAIAFDQLGAELDSLEPAIKHAEVEGAESLVGIDLRPHMGRLRAYREQSGALESRLVALDAELEDAPGVEPARTLLSARLAAACMEAWYWRSWLARYERCFDAITHSEGGRTTSLLELMTEVVHYPFDPGGVRHLQRLAPRLSALLRRVAERSVPLDRAVAGLLLRACALSRIRRRPPECLPAEDRTLLLELRNLADRLRTETALRSLGPMAADLMALGASRSRDERVTLSARLSSELDTLVSDSAPGDPAAESALRVAIDPIREELAQPRFSR